MSPSQRHVLPFASALQTAEVVWRIKHRRLRVPH